jgi:hypothetical protein
MFLGNESIGAKNMPVLGVPRMNAFLWANGPWDQVVRYWNIQLRPVSDGTKVLGKVSLCRFLLYLLISPPIFCASSFGWLIYFS